METLTTTGMLTFRTKLLELDLAARFALCLQANPRFCAVEIQTSARKKSERKYFVTYLPTNEKRALAMLDRQQEARAKRAAEQEFVFCHDGDHDFYHCHSLGSGEVYETTLNSCSCPDHQFRCQPNGLACKHRLALGDHIREERTVAFQPVPDLRADQDRFEAIFADPNTEWMR